MKKNPDPGITSQEYRDQFPGCDECPLCELDDGDGSYPMITNGVCWSCVCGCDYCEDDSGRRWPVGGR